MDLSSPSLKSWIYPAIRRKAGFIRTVRQAAPAPKSYFLDLMAVAPMAGSFSASVPAQSIYQAYLNTCFVLCNRTLLIQI